MKLKISCIIIFLIGLAYLLVPLPSKIEDFSAVPNSYKYSEQYDGIRYHQIISYLTDYRRQQATTFYKQQLQTMPFFPPIRLNHPPEEARQLIRDEERSTYLEEFVYPLKGSIFINGYEPFDINGYPFDNRSYPLDMNGRVYASKLTVRYYPVSMATRILAYLLIWLSIWLIYRTAKHLFKAPIR